MYWEPQMFEAGFGKNPGFGEVYCLGVAQPNDSQVAGLGDVRMGLSSQAARAAQKGYGCVEGRSDERGDDSTWRSAFTTAADTSTNLRRQPRD